MVWREAFLFSQSPEAVLDQAVSGFWFLVPRFEGMPLTRNQKPEHPEVNPMSFVNGLKCRECGREYEKSLKAGCEDCFAPLEIDYNYEAISRALTREVIKSREKTLWRYRELLPLDGEPTVGR